MRETQQIIDDLNGIEQELGEKIMQRQDHYESLGQYSSGFGQICVPEDAAPGLDTARGFIQDAIRELGNDA
jgi:hypothetical protein